MFSYLVSTLRVAKVQAELIAQIKNQALVNQICHQPKVLELINFLFNNAYYKKRKDASFLIVCAIMVMVLNDDEIARNEKEIYYLILKERFEKMQQDRQYCIDNFMIVGDCDNALAVWEKNAT